MVGVVTFIVDLLDGGCGSSLALIATSEQP